MPARGILQLGDPLLRAVSSPVSDPSAAQPLFQDLRDTLGDFRRAHGFGRGISAVQIGEPKRLIYIEMKGTAYFLRNPVCTFRSVETFQLWDDCFSFPDLMVRVERSERVSVSYLDARGESRVIEARGAFSELLQHELDHLDGVLAVDRALGRDSLATRAEWERRYRNAPETGARAS